ncbi:MAG: hypothetical protein ABJA67_10020 [Chthonomonadales bacterium]
MRIALLWLLSVFLSVGIQSAKAQAVQETVLPVGSAPAALNFEHFPDRLHAFVWRNWPLVRAERMAEAIGAKPDQVRQIGMAMGLGKQPTISDDQWNRSYLTIIRRNWHLLPYPQLLKLLGWTSDHLAYILREDDFLYVKLGSLKPRCDPIVYSPPDARTRERVKAIAAQVAKHYSPGGVPLFNFVKDLSRSSPKRPLQPAGFKPCFCYSYFALYGDPLLDAKADPYPDAYLQRLSASGVNGVWLQAVLYKLTPFPWDPHVSEHYAERLANLKKLVARAKKHGIGIYLYTNEPRAMENAFFKDHPNWKGPTEGEYSALCTSAPEVQAYLKDSVKFLCKAVPDLGGLFTITASENLTNCWSHGGGKQCPRCGPRGSAAVISEVNRLIQEGINASGASTKLITWDWGWPEDQANAIIDALPTNAYFMSVSEWDMPIHRGGVDSVVGEYSVSAVGPGDRAKRHWARALAHGMKPIAKIQAANSWELSAVPYLPVLENVAQHAANFRANHVTGMMAGWTLGGYPSPNLEVVREVGAGADPETAMKTVATRRFGANAAPMIVKAWKAYSAAFREFPFHIGMVYTAPMQYGPSNLLWGQETGYRATMIGFPYDDLESWRAVYPPDVFISQMRKVAGGFDAARIGITNDVDKDKLSSTEREAYDLEMGISEAAAIHFHSTANQAQFVQLRRKLTSSISPEIQRSCLIEMDGILRNEIELATRLIQLQQRDSRVGFEASNQYYYVPIDLMEKILNCQDLLDRWLPEIAKRLKK